MIILPLIAGDLRRISILESNAQHYNRAVVLMWIGSILIGINFVANSYLIASFSPLFLCFIRLLITSVFLLTISYKLESFHKPTKKEWWILLVATLFGSFLFQMFYFIGLQYSTAGNASLILALSPLLTNVIAIRFLQERLTMQKLLGMILGLGGVIIIVFPGISKGNSIIGVLYLLTAALVSAVTPIMVKRLSVSMHSDQITVYLNVLGALFMAPAVVVEMLRGDLMVSSDVFKWMVIIITCIFVQGLVGFWFTKGIAVLGAGRSSLFTNLPPFTAIIAAYFFLGDPIQASQLLGGILILIGVFIGNKRRLNQAAKLESHLEV